MADNLRSSELDRLLLCSGSEYSDLDSEIVGEDDSVVRICPRLQNYSDSDDYTQKTRCRQLEHVVWSPGGELFAIPMDCKVEITSTDIGGVVNTLSLSSKVSACTFLSDEVLGVGEASGGVRGFSVTSGDQLWHLEGDQRVRCLQCLHSHLVTATSIGVISVFSLEDPTTQPELITSVDTGCRITCLTLFDYKSMYKVKKEIPNNEKINNEKLLNADAKRNISSKERKDDESITNCKKVKKSKKCSFTNYKSSESNDVICCPKSQKWIVESSQR